MKTLRSVLLCTLAAALTGTLMPVAAQQPSGTGYMEGVEPPLTATPIPVAAQQPAGYLDDDFARLDSAKWLMSLGNPSSLQAMNGLLVTYRAGQTYSGRGSVISNVALPSEFALLVNILGGVEIKTAAQMQPKPLSALYPTTPAPGAYGPAAPTPQFGRPRQPGAAPGFPGVAPAPTAPRAEPGPGSGGAAARRAEKRGDSMQFQRRRDEEGSAARAAVGVPGAAAAVPRAGVPGRVPGAAAAPAFGAPTTPTGPAAAPAYQPYPTDPQAAALLATLGTEAGWNETVTGDYAQAADYVPGVQFGLKLRCTDGNVIVALRGAGDPLPDTPAGVEVAVFSNQLGEQGPPRIPVPAGQWAALRIDVRGDRVKIYVGAEEFDYPLPGAVREVQLGDVSVGGTLKPAKTTSYLLTNFHLRPFASPQPAGGIAESIFETSVVSGDRYLAAGDYENARVMYERAYVATPDSVEALAKLGYTQGVTRGVEGGLKLASRATERNPNSYFAHLYRGRLLYDMGRDSEARQELSTATALQPASPEALFLSAQALADRALRPALSRRAQDREAIALYQACLDRAGSYAVAWEALGLVYYDHGESQKAIDALENAVKFDPQLLYARRALADLYQGRGDTGRAAAHRSAIRRNWSAYPRCDQISVAADEMNIGYGLADPLRAELTQAQKYADSGALRPAFARLRALERAAVIADATGNLWTRCLDTEARAAKRAGQTRLWQMVRFSGFDGWNQKYAYRASPDARGALVTIQSDALRFNFAVTRGVTSAATKSFDENHTLYASASGSAEQVIPASQAWRGSAGLAIGMLGIMSTIQARQAGWQQLALGAIHDVLRHRYASAGTLEKGDREILRALFLAMAWPEPDNIYSPGRGDRWALNQLQAAIDSWKAGGAFRSWGVGSGATEIFWDWQGSLSSVNAQTLLWLHSTWLLRQEIAREYKRALAGGLEESLNQPGYWQWNDKVTPNLLKSRTGYALAYGVADNPQLTYLLDLMGFAGRCYAGLDANVRRAIAGVTPQHRLGYTDSLSLGERFLFEGYNILRACQAAGVPVRPELARLLESDVNYVRAWLGEQPTYAFQVRQAVGPFVRHR